MSGRPRHPKPDTNQAQIKRDLEAARFPHIWLDVSSLPVRCAGGDVFILGYSLRLHTWALLLVEIKMPGEDLNANEVRFHAMVEQICGDDPDVPVIVARCAEDVLRWFGRIE